MTNRDKLTDSSGGGQLTTQLLLKVQELIDAARGRAAAAVNAELIVAFAPSAKLSGVRPVMASKSASVPRSRSSGLV